MFISKIKNFAIPIVFLLALLGSIFLEGVLPDSVKSFLYGTSLLIKEILIFALPIIIFSLVFNAIRQLGSKAIKFIIIIVPLICFSNFLNTSLSYISSLSFLKMGVIQRIVENNSLTTELLPMFNFHLPKLISNDIALLSGAVLGLLSGIFKINYLQKISNIFGSLGKNSQNNTIKREKKLEKPSQGPSLIGFSSIDQNWDKQSVPNFIGYILDLVTKYFFKFLLPIMPFFIIGTSLKLQHDGVLEVIYTKYLAVLGVFIISAYGVVILEYFVLAGFRLRQFSEYIKNVLPAVITGFGSGSSAAALPLSISAAEKNVRHNKGIAHVIVPATVNNHLVGDCFFIPMSALVIMYSYGMAMPSVAVYAIFASYFVIAKFAVAAIPGGGILVMLPILQTYLGFNSDMLGLITAIYIIFDPIITACNVMGNGAMAMIFDRIAGRTSHT